MEIEPSIVLSGLISGIILGTALSISRLLRGTVIVCIATFLVWVFIESDENGIVLLFESILNHALLNTQFFLSVAIGAILSIACYAGKLLNSK